jgi:hypothetical protein
MENGKEAPAPFRVVPAIAATGVATIRPIANRFLIFIKNFEDKINFINSLSQIKFGVN